MYSVVVGSISALCVVAQDAWRNHLRLRKWVAEINGRPDDFALFNFLLERLKHDPCLPLMLAGLAGLVSAFIVYPPEAISFVMPLWERFSIVVAAICLFGNAWVLSGRYALRVEIPLTEIIEAESGPMLWYHTHVSCGGEKWVIRRTHAEF